MSERIDHATEAMTRVERIKPGQLAVDAQVLLGIAQVHATLALVEQQRIANVIALASLRIGPNDTPALRHLAIEPHGLDGVRPAAGIREGLGLS